MRITNDHGRGTNAPKRITNAPRYHAYPSEEEDWLPPPPYLSAARPAQPAEPAAPPAQPTDPRPAPSATPAPSSISADTDRRTYDLRDRQKPEKTITAPLREIVQVVPQTDGTNLTVRAFQFVPFSSSDLLSWKLNYPPYSENPQKLTELCESIMSSHNPTWSDCKQLLMTLFSREERTLIQEAAVKLLKARVPAGETELTWVAARFPDLDPKWDYSKPDQLERLREYQQLLIEAMRAGMKKPVNLSRPREILQEAHETPDHFYERLLEAYQRFTPLEISDPANQRTINLSFVSQSWPDIKKKLQKQEGFEGMPISYLLELARKTFNNRDEAERVERNHRAQRKAQFLAAALTQSAPQFQHKRPPRARADQCFNCLETTHRVANCPYPKKPRPQQQTRQRGDRREMDERRQRHQKEPHGQVQQGIYRSNASQLSHPLNPTAPAYAPQELVGIAGMDQWDIPE